MDLKLNVDAKRNSRLTLKGELQSLRISGDALNLLSVFDQEGAISVGMFFHAEGHELLDAYCRASRKPDTYKVNEQGSNKSDGV